MRKIKHPKIGEYVLLTKYSDKDPRDPWSVGFISAIIYTDIAETPVLYSVRGDNRTYKNCFRITPEEGEAWIRENKSE